ncbi:hypothetical protein Afil01_49320 [Actinorhabdospora filicis]|uniref:CARDB domain-containing protein n=1 Tax=Actinorhabdospora filicis TaxID=1785913 RepID=A0A9W6SNG6_9ACTN|nr:CARDB domain-containing protein [Actinorhabdospora filicis]GLZ80125.1 hypothetical protein Afil01_49320 [Actinorhabdospora filicis]
MGAISDWLRALIRRIGELLRHALGRRSPNLWIEMLAFTGDSIYVGEPFPLEAKIWNEGKSASAATQVVILALDSSYNKVGTTTAPVGAIQPANYVRVKLTHPGLPRVETYLLRATVDPQNTVPESNEHDNEHTLTVYVKRRP